LFLHAIFEDEALGAAEIASAIAEDHHADDDTEADGVTEDDGVGQATDVVLDKFAPLRDGRTGTSSAGSSTAALEAEGRADGA
jgi:hypothetical protein